MPSASQQTQREAEAYYRQMAQRGRLVVASAEGLPWVLVTFFVLTGREEIKRFHHRPLWSCPPDAEEGLLVYVDTLAALAWNRELFRVVERLVATHVPSYRYAVWFRPSQTGEKRYTWRRRIV